MAETRLKIAVFIDFDNIEIGVKTTLGGHFDVGAVLEAIKERGEVVTKVAYGDWTRAGDYSRSLTQHAIHMVQRNLTPGGDKNGADINLALDALEMAFTHNHINAFVIVGGDSDFMALVEKLKQYDRKVFVVGGRAFTSIILQKNCHEFIAYENLVGSSARRPGSRGKTAPETSPAQAVALIRRALKVLADREVSPQLGVLKSTLLQLDSTFSEREYGASTFRDFIQRLARAGYVTLKGTDRNIYVELREGVDGAPSSTPPPPSGKDADTLPQELADAAPSADGDQAAIPLSAEVILPSATPPLAATPPAPPAGSASPTGAGSQSAGSGAATSSPSAPPSPAAAKAQEDGYRFMLDVFQRPGLVSRWPLYLRQVKQVLKSVDESFDERRYGFSGIVEALRYAQRESLFRLDRDRQGVLRVYPGPLLQRVSTASQPADSIKGSDGVVETVVDVDRSEPAAMDLFPPDENAGRGSSDGGDAGARAASDSRATGDTVEAEILAVADAVDAPAEQGGSRSPRRRKRTAKSAAPRKTTSREGTRDGGTRDSGRDAASAREGHGRDSHTREAAAPKPRAAKSSRPRKTAKATKDKSDKNDR